ncbi:MAG: hypothetical protein R3251_02855 [Candidatus Spechtbacterales bacterium]|nr:hypothetical protein [Candidatus Spechtbacterales bacterium]
MKITIGIIGLMFLFSAAYQAKDVIVRYRRYKGSLKAEKMATFRIFYLAKYRNSRKIFLRRFIIGIILIILGGLL